MPDAAVSRVSASACLTRLSDLACVVSAHGAASAGEASTPGAASPSAPPAAAPQAARATAAPEHRVLSKSWQRTSLRARKGRPRDSLAPPHRQPHSIVTISGYRTRRRPPARIRHTHKFGRPKRALSAAFPTRMRPMSARFASPAYSGRRYLAGLRRGRRMRRHGLATVLPCYSLRGRRSQSI